LWKRVTGRLKSGTISLLPVSGMAETEADLSTLPPAEKSQENALDVEGKVNSEMHWWRYVCQVCLGSTHCLAEVCAE